MKRIGLLIILLVLTACSPKPTYTGISVMAPKGAPAIALIPLIKGDLDQVELIDGTDLLSAELINGDADMVIAPINLGALLIKNNNTKYRLYGIVTWGNLFVVAEKDMIITANHPMAIFGLQSVPGLIFNKVKSTLDYTVSLNNFNSVADVLGQLMAKNYRIGLLAEPLVSAAIAGAKDNGLNLEVISDLQVQYKAVTGYDNYPQAAIFVKSDADEATLKQVKYRIEDMKKYTSDASKSITNLLADIDAITPERLGIPSSTIIALAWHQMHVDVQLAKDYKTEIEAFLALINLSNIEGLYQE